MKKGITPIIALVLMLMIVLSIAGGFMVWMSAMQTGLENKTAEQIEQQTGQMAKTVRIVTISCNNDMVYVRNTGSQTIGSGSLLVINMDTGEQNTNANSMDPGSVLGITLSTDGITDGDRIEADAPGNTDSQTASC